MKIAELKKQLEGTLLPVCYRAFKTKQKLPFISFYVENEDVEGSDFENFWQEVDIVIELYSDFKDVLNEEKIQEIIKNKKYSKHEVYIESESMILVRYEFTEVIKK